LGAVPGRFWKLAAAVALGSGIWCMQVQGIAHLLRDVPAGLHAVISLVALALAVAVCLAAIGWSSAAAPRKSLLAGGAAALALCTLVTQLLLHASLDLQPPIKWRLVPVTLAFMACAAAFAAALHLCPLPGQDHAKARWRQGAAAGMACVAVWLCQVLSVDMAALAGATPRVDGTMINAQMLANVSSIACIELLLLMLLACAFEKRVTGSLERAHHDLQRQPLHDELTGLPNRTLFEGRLAQALQQADEAKHEVVVMLVALDAFKHVNEEFGHQQGDAVLLRTAEALRALAPPHSVARLAGDEFLLLVSGADAARCGATLAPQVLDAVALPWQANGRDCSVTCSIGLAVYPRHGALSALLTHAGVALRAAKSAGGASHAFFDPRMVSATKDQAELLFDLRQALSRGQLELYYQPKIHAPSAQIMGVEALLRWHHPKRGIISPEIFIPLAERHGLIDALGDWVIDEACQQARRWRDQGLRMRVAVNVSAHQLRHHDLPACIGDALKRHHINPALLTCEITESVAMEDTEVTMRFFTDVAALGVHLSIDDFGSGYSSLAYLRKLPATELKIDRSFVLDLETSAEARKIAQAVVQLAQSLNMTVVAEGVETDEQYRLLRSFGCDQLQGFLFAKPMSAKALTLWAMADNGPRSMQFRESLFQETRAVAL
jgi:diguanylate cyclase (GGDEF)-like protein